MITQNQARNTPTLAAKKFWQRSSDFGFFIAPIWVNLLPASGNTQHCRIRRPERWSKK